MNRKQRRAVEKQGTTPRKEHAAGEPSAPRPSPRGGEITLSSQVFAYAVQLHQSGRVVEAERIYRAILAEEPDHAENLNLLGVVAAQTGHLDQATGYIDKAITLKNDDSSFHNNLGEVLRLQSRLPEATQAFRTALILEPGYAEALNNLGATRHAMGRLEEAIGHYRRALALKGHYPEALNNIGAAYQECHRLDLAMMHYRQAIALKPTYAEAHSNLGTVLLGHGQFAEGWREYEWRLCRNDADLSRTESNCLLPKPGAPASAPTIGGEPDPHEIRRNLAGKTILLHSEQGLGDALQFARFATPIAALGAKVILEVPAPLAGLLSCIDGVSQVVAKGETLPSFDFFLSSMSAPFLLGTTLDTIPSAVPYVSPAAASVAAWADRVGALPGLKVGLVWAGAPRLNDPRNHAIDRRRSMALADMAPLLTIPGISFVSLQMGTPARQSQEIAADRRPRNWTAEISDFADTAGLMASLDLVISVDTSVAHLAGAMGKPVWILSRFDGCWRWLTDRDDSPWYPTARLFRQTEPGNWRTVIARVAEALRERADGVSLPLVGGQEHAHSRDDGIDASSPTREEGEERQNDAEMFFRRGVALQSSGRPLEAEAAYRAVLAADPRHAMALNNLGNALKSQGRRDEAIAALHEAIVLQPDYAEAHYNLGLLFHQEGHLHQAEDAYRNALRLRPDFIEALTNLGSALQDLDRLDEAEAIQRACLARQPNYARAHLNLGVVLKRQGRLDETIDACRRAIDIQENYPLAHINLAHALLLRGDFTEGWREYEWRWRGGVDGLVPRYPADTRWIGQKIAGRTLLLHAEQGLGDVLQFVRYAALFTKAKASVILEVHAPLVRLLSSLPGIDRVVAMGEPMPAFDYHLPMMSAPYAFGIPPDGIPADVPYITPDAALTDAWSKRLARLPGLKVGLVWAGDPRPHDYRLTAADGRRSIALSRLRPLLSMRGVSFVGLQKGKAAAQIADLPPELQPLDLMDDVTDFADTAAIVANLDLVISVDTSVAHLAGAMGKPVWILSRFDGCWRWLTDRDDSPWYPTARLFRQTTAGDWETVIAHVGKELERFAAPCPPHRGKGKEDDITLTRLFAEARAHHLAGRLSEAEAGYRHILTSRPQHADSLHLLGAAAFQTGRNALASDLLRRSIALVPASAEALNNLGNVLCAEGLLDAAIDVFQRALRLKQAYPEALINLGKALLRHRQHDKAEKAFLTVIGLTPDNAHARYCLGVVRQEQGRLAGAVTAYRTALTLQPDDHQAFNNLGNALKDQGHWEQAITSLRTAFLINPDYWEAHYNLGVAFHQQGRLGEALVAYRAALAVKPDLPEAQTNLGNALRDLGQIQQAEVAQRASLEARPDYPRAQNNLGIILKEQGRLTEALAALQQAVTDQPDYAEAYNNLGVTLMAMERPKEAIAALHAALACKPQDPEPQNNLGVVFHQQGRLKDALTAYERAVGLNPDYAEAQTNLGMVRLACGDDVAGWRGYEWRWKGGLANLTTRNFPQPPWQGESLAGRTILLHGEQGFGDVLQFVRYVPFVAARGGRVVLEAYPSLVRLLHTLAGPAQIVAAGMPLPAFDCHLPLMSLPHVLGAAVGPQHTAFPYLHAAPADITIWRQRLSGRAGPTVGLVWAGNPRLHDPGASAIDRRRSIALSRLSPILTIPGIDFVSLQTGSAAAQIQTLSSEHRPADLAGDITDFADTAGLIANLDLLISVDTAAVHLAGALGKPVWILSRFDGCWRWGVERDDTPWYPTARLFRQKAPGDWETVVERVAVCLRRWAESGFREADIK